MRSLPIHMTGVESFAGWPMAASLCFSLWITRSLARAGPVRAATSARPVSILIWEAPWLEDGDVEEPGSLARYCAESRRSRSRAGSRFQWNAPAPLLLPHLRLVHRLEGHLGEAGGNLVETRGRILLL